MYSKKNDLKGKVAEALNRNKDFNFKERFGVIPKSIMKFKKSDELMQLIDWDDSELGKIEGDAKPRGKGYAANLRYSIYNPDQALFIIDYYTKPNDLIIDPFMGRATRPLISLYLGRRYIGFDTSTKTVELNRKLVSKKFPDASFSLFRSDGTDMVELKDCIDAADAIFTCPPYYNLEKYSGEKGDLSQLSEEDYNTRIKVFFRHCYRLIKTSDYEALKFSPVIITVGSVRKGKRGIVDMDYLFQSFAREVGFVLYDKLFTENNTPGAGFTFRRNYSYSYVTKNYETTLVFMKFK
jgi:DNA modification methylase